MLPGNDVNLFPINLGPDPRGITFVEFDSINFGKKLYPHRRNTHPDDFPVLKENPGLKIRVVHPELSEDINQPDSIIRRDRHPNVHIGGGPGITVITHGVTSDQQVPNISLVQQPQEFFEVGGKYMLVHRLSAG